MKRFGILLVMVMLSACTSQDPLYVERPLKEIYSKANDAMTKENYEKAADLFDEVERQYPYSDSASKAQLLSAYCAFKGQKFERAIASLDTFLVVTIAVVHAHLYYWGRIAEIAIKLKH